MWPARQHANLTNELPGGYGSFDFLDSPIRSSRLEQAASHGDKDVTRRITLVEERLATPQADPVCVGFKLLHNMRKQGAKGSKELIEVVGQVDGAHAMEGVLVDLPPELRTVLQESLEVLRCESCEAAILRAPEITVQWLTGRERRGCHQVSTTIVPHDRALPGGSRLPEPQGSFQDEVSSARTLVRFSDDLPHLDRLHTDQFGQFGQFGIANTGKECAADAGCPKIVEHALSSSITETGRDYSIDGGYWSKYASHNLARDSMPRIDIYSNYDLVATLRLESEEVLIGRETGSHVCLKDEKVSRTHAIIRRCGQVHEIESQGRNGTKVNGTSIDGRQVLCPGDSIFVSRYVLVYQTDEPDKHESVNTVALD